MPEPGAVAAPAPKTTTRIELPTRTIVKVVLTLVVIWMLVTLASILLQLFIALLLTAALDPLVTRLERRGLPRVVAVAIVFVALVAGTAGVLLILIPPLIDQGNQFAKDLPSYTDRARRLLDENPDLYNRIRSAASRGSADPSTLLTGFLAFGQGLLQAISNTLIVLVMTAYLLVDGERVFLWVTHYLPVEQRLKIRRALPEISRVVSGYVAGQIVTSALFGIFAFVVLRAAGVPQSLLLAIVAALADAIPIAGVFIATVPATLLAWTVSLPAALIVLALYVAYQQVENYVIVPRVYRNTLEISSFAVLVAVLVGGELLGIIGVLLALPIAAAIPVVERIWLGDAEEAPAKAGAATDGAGKTAGRHDGSP